MGSQKYYRLNFYFKILQIEYFCIKIRQLGSGHKKFNNALRVPPHPVVKVKRGSGGGGIFARMIKPVWKCGDHTSNFNCLPAEGAVSVMPIEYGNSKKKKNNSFYYIFFSIQ